MTSRIKGFIKISGLIGCFLLFALAPVMNYAQDPDYPVINNDDDEENRIENLINNSDEDGEYDYSDLFEDLDYFRNHKLNLNTATEEDLRRLYILNDIQISNLLTHIEKNGKLISLYELQSIDGFDLVTIYKILPFVKIGSDDASLFNFKDMFRHGESDLFVRYQTIIEEQEGYSPISDSALEASPNSRYLGSPEKIYTRYRFKYYNKVSFGITAEKDQGEEFFTGTQPNGFDFYSAHLMVRDVSIFKIINIGDYHVQFGQGLTMWTGMGFGKSSEVISIGKMARGIMPYTSVDENNFMRGAATTIKFKKFSITGFYSRKLIDANVSVYDSTTSELLFVSSIQETGQHRTPGELADKDAFLEEIAGGNISYRNRRLQIGATVCNMQYDADLQRDLKIYNQFEFTGNSNLNYGMDYSYIFRNINFFGEVARSSSGGMAFLDGMMICLDPRVSMSILYRNYEKNYHALYSNAFSEGSRLANEEGIYTGLNIKFSKRWNLSFYSDHVNFPWLRYRVNAPSTTHDYLAEIKHRPTKKIEMYIRYKYETKYQNNTDEENMIDYPVPLDKQTIRYNISCQATEEILLKSRVEMLEYQHGEDPKEHGYVIYQDVRYKPEKLPFSISLRYALFDTDTYDAKIYTYENDVLYSYSTPGLYYKGSRFYIMTKIDLIGKLDLWIRYALTSYTNRNVVSSGMSEIDGNKKSELKVQLRYRF